VTRTIDESAQPHGKARRILLLDDEPVILRAMARYFRKLGWTVDSASEPEEAEALTAHRRYDLAILDMRLTRFGNAEGLEVLRHIRKHDPWTGVIVLSAYVSAELEEEAVRLGADVVLRKPQPLPQLAQIVLALVGDRS
jgi:CheY-like chemotaxis protein